MQDAKNIAKNLLFP